MKSLENNIEKLDSAFEGLFNNLENDYENEAKIIASKILSEISEIADKKDLNRKNIADLIGTSASYLTQLYRGNKILNLITLAKLKNKLNLNITINISSNDYNETSDVINYKSYSKEVDVDGLKHNWLILSNLLSNNEDEAFLGGNKKSMNIVKKQLTA